MKLVLALTLLWINLDLLQYSFAEAKKRSCNPRSVSDRFCRPECNNRRDCKAKRKVKNCVCDAECGRSCISRGQTCKEIPPILTKRGFTKLNGVRYRHKSTFRFGDVLTFHCNKGYTLSGPSSLRCSGIRKWKPWDQGIPKCSRQCPEVRSPENGRINRKNYEIGAVLTFRCHPGYNLVGQNSITCRRDLTWSGTSPTCKVHTCQEPRMPPNAKIGRGRQESYFFGDRLYILCQPGYFRRGNPIMTCLNGKFSFSTPAMKCFPKSCGNPGYLRHGTRKGLVFTFKQTVTFSCNPGYELRGSPYRTCLANQKWSGVKSTCEKIDCGYPPMIENGESDLEGTKFGQSRYITCHRGYQLSGPSKVTCQANKKWSHDTRCTIVTCPPEKLIISHGTSKGLEGEKPCTNIYNCRVRFMCDSGYYLVGTEAIVCTQSGSWNEQPPKCEAKHCGHPGSVPNANKRGAKYTFNNTVEYVCNEGYNIVGNSLLRCNEEGDWSSSLPSCQAKNCGLPRGNTTAFLVNQNPTYSYPEQLTYKCHTGYRIQGASSIRCLSSGIWDSEVPKCEEVTCEPFGKIDNVVQYGASPFRVNDNIRFRCKEGYKPFIETSLTCLENGRWNDRPPTCQIVTCSFPEIDKNSQLETADNNFVFNSFVRVKCNRGFKLVGEEFLTCLANGTWGKNIPRCEEICDLPLLMKSDKTGDAQPKTVDKITDEEGEISLKLELQDLVRITQMVIQIGNTTKGKPQYYKLKYVDGNSGYEQLEKIGFLSFSSSGNKGTVAFNQAVVTSRIELVILVNCRSCRLLITIQFLGCSAKTDCYPNVDVKNGRPVIKVYKKWQSFEYTCNSGFYPQLHTKAPYCNGRDFIGTEVICENDSRYIGCYALGSISDKIFGAKVFFPNVCIQWCSRAGYDKAMLTYNSMCRCTQKSLNDATKFDDLACNTRCVNKSYICGGGGMASIFRTKVRHFYVYRGYRALQRSLLKKSLWWSV